MSATEIELDKETLIRGRSMLFKGCCATEWVSIEGIEKKWDGSNWTEEE